jgi:AcrR family transcriptional regulator
MASRGEQMKTAKSQMAEGGAYNQVGQKLGAKGRRTRKLLIDTTVALLETHGLRDLSVADVARAAETSPATFYVYFPGVPEVVLAALEDITHISPEIEALIAQSWLLPGAASRALKLVSAFTDRWNTHRTIFLVRNLAGEEGDVRFLKARTDASQPVLRALTLQVECAQQAGRVPAELSPRACAATVVMVLERLAAVGPVQAKKGLTYADLRASAAYLVGNMLGARD